MKAARKAQRLVRHSSGSPKIIWTHTDEAPALASYALLPVIQRFANYAGVNIESSDISVAGRILSQFPDKLKPEQRVKDELAELGRLATTPEANIIKLPNGVLLGARLWMSVGVGVCEGRLFLTGCVRYRSVGVRPSIG